MEGKKSHWSQAISKSSQANSVWFQGLGIHPCGSWLPFLPTMSGCVSLEDKPHSGRCTSSALCQHFAESGNVTLGPRLQLGRPLRPKSKFSLQIEGNKSPDRHKNLLVGKGHAQQVSGGTGETKPRVFLLVPRSFPLHLSNST